MMAPQRSAGTGLVSTKKHFKEIKRYLGARTLEAAIPGELKRHGARLTRYERMGGLTNRNYKLYLGDEVLVLRLPGRGTGRFINRAHERANQYDAARAGFSPEALYFNKVTGVKISSFLSGAETLSPATIREPERYRRVARFLRAFHDAPLGFGNAFDGFSMSRKYERLAKARLARLYDGYTELRERVFALEPALAAYSVALRACHDDLVPENILDVGGRLQLIDWEYSGMNDPAWDLASLFLESEFGDDAALDFLGCYRGAGESVEGLFLRVRAHQVVQDFLWSLWSLLQADAQKDPAKEEYYLRYGRERFDRAGSMIRSFETDYGFRPREAMSL